MATRELFAASISLVLCRVLMEVLARIDESLRVPPQFVLLANCGLVLLLVAGYAMQLLGEERVVRAERDRIAGDLHDGLGFHLTTALALAGNTRKTDAEAWLAVDLALMELHSVIHFMHAESVPIVHTMGSLRGRLQKVVERQGLELVWRVRDDIPSEVLRGAAAYHFTKIVQEALSNVMQHARATRLIVELTCSWAPGLLVLRIVDNGRGIGQSAPSGRGLEGMARRAGLLGGTLRIEQMPEGGTCVWLSVPWRREGLLSAVTQRAAQHRAS